MVPPQRNRWRCKDASVIQSLIAVAKEGEVEAGWPKRYLCVQSTVLKFTVGKYDGSNRVDWVRLSELG